MSEYGENRGYANYHTNTAYKTSETVEECLELEVETEREYQEYLRKKRARRRKRILEERRRRRRRALLIAWGIRIVGVMLIFAVFFSLIRALFFSNPVKKRLTVEAGTELAVEDFLKKEVKAEFVTKVSEIDVNHVGKQVVLISAEGKERKTRLTVEDTEAPEAEADPISVDVDGEVAPEELVTNIQDATDVTCAWKETPDLSEKGTVPAVVVLTDEGGNKTEVETEIKVIVDNKAPVIDGVAPLTGFIGEPVSYKSEITVTDNCDKEVELIVDNSQVDVEEEGTYDVFYKAVDRAGNEAEASTTITMNPKPDNYIEPEEVYAEADEVLEEITTEDMTLKEKARAIYDWTREEIGYVNTSDKESWTNGAHQGFTEHSGDCFVFFATAKALLTEAGIPNLDVVKSDTSHSSHYWSLIDCGDGWYHFDTTPRIGGGEFFMKTDAEILEYSEAHRDSHIFDQSLYPATPETESTIK